MMKLSLAATLYPLHIQLSPIIVKISMVLPVLLDQTWTIKMLDVILGDEQLCLILGIPVLGIFMHTLGLMVCHVETENIFVQKPCQVSLSTANLLAAWAETST